MTDYTPDRWVVVNFVNEGQRFSKVLAEWKGGGMAGSDHWQMNSGITEAIEEPNYWLFYGASGSIYRCAKGRYGVSGSAASVLRNLLYNNSDSVSIQALPEDTDWTGLEMVEKK